VKDGKIGFNWIAIFLALERMSKQPREQASIAEQTFFILHPLSFILSPLYDRRIQKQRTDFY
jgi:hypothetical protein